MSKPLAFFGMVLIFFGSLLPFKVIAETETSDKNVFTLTSSNFKNKGIIPAEFATKKVKGGRNISPPLQWKNAPENTRSFALIVIDLNPVARRWIHWMVINIPPNIKSLSLNASSGKMPDGSVELNNSYGNIGWGGPQPPKGTGFHKYIFCLYSLNVKKIESRPENEKEFLKAIKGKIVSRAILTGFFKQ